MSVCYIFDLNEVLKEEDLHIPFLDGLHYFRIDIKDLTVAKIIETRNTVMADVNTPVNMHQFFFVIKNEKETLKALSRCISDIQNTHQQFNAQNYEVHVVCNFTNEEGFDIIDYEKGMPCLVNNKVCVYSWLLEKYDYNGDKLIKETRRSHAILRMIQLLNKHTEISDVLTQMTHTTNTPKPIFNLFGDASLVFDVDKRNKAVRDFYCFKSIQHLLNLPDAVLDDYIKANVLPFAKDQKELEKRIDATSEGFLNELRRPIEASVITEKTQKLLLKSSDDDEEYLVKASDNKLAFIEELSKTEGWQLEGMPEFLSEFQGKVGLEGAVQETISEDFLDQLYSKFVIHEREDFNIINNQISDSRHLHIEQFKQMVDRQMNGFLNQQERVNYASLQSPLTSEETAKHHTNIDYAIAFLEYLEAGKTDNLADKDVSTGDINFSEIRKSLEKEESKRHQEYKEQRNNIDEKYRPGEDGKPSKVKEKFDEIDKLIKSCQAEKHQSDFQLNHWIDGDAGNKLTARAKMMISFGCGFLAALLWLFISIEFLSDFMKSLITEDYDQFQWTLAALLVTAGIVVGIVILMNALRRKREAEEALENALQQKRLFMHLCVKEMNENTEKHYNYFLAHHGLKTMDELINFSIWKKEDLINFQKTLFKMMLQYWLAVADYKPTTFVDDNTIEVTDKDVNSMLFGTEDNRRKIPYCFAQDGLVLSETFNEYKRKKARFETTRNSFNFIPKNFDKEELEKEIIPCMVDHEGSGIKYTVLNETSILPPTESDVEIDDIHQGACGDCYFMATLAAIARVNPNFIIGKNGMIEELGEDHRFFRVKFHDKDGKRVNVDIDNRFWNIGDEPYYAKKGIQPQDAPKDSYDPWVMAVEKAWAKVNCNGYDGIVGAREDGKELERKVEYSYAVTGKSAFYCMTKNVPDGGKLHEMMKKHFLVDKLPITLYSFSPSESQFADPNLVQNHAYALRSVNDDGTFDIFNPWNSHDANENVKGKHYQNVGINFIKDNFAVVVFFGIEEADFDSFERGLTQNAAEDEVSKWAKTILDESFNKLELPLSTFDDLITEHDMSRACVFSNYLFSQNLIKDPRGVEGGTGHLVFLEGGQTPDCQAVNQEMVDYLRSCLPGGISLLPLLLRSDDKQILTLFRLSPHYVIDNFYSK